jgi:signal transduction histidine kinase
MKTMGKHAEKIRRLEAQLARLRERSHAKPGDAKLLQQLNAKLGKLAEERALEGEGMQRLLSQKTADIKARRERIATTVHDLKVPITISLLNLELAEMEADASEKDNYHTSVRRELEFLLDTIGNLLDIEQAESDALELRYQQINLPELLDGIIDRMRVLIRDKPELVILNRLPKRTPSLNGDRQKLTRVFNNLISNSIKYTDSGTITVGAKPRRKKGAITLFVADSGQGIVPDRLPELFEFFKGDALRQDSSGVGLALVKQVVSAHKGTVWLESERDVGTTVFVELPLG